ncbi:hypothetical protein CAL29_02820 [Bordetella genomosp. 10]|uniref:Uncharacterized protein n=1 Tax=Bordetella genomosp. 10 TaxID=1416804 RepID=A0A261SK27_9BORD|nr:hypothetical protein CAL29_02820 [Bordetella genomosp. 10]
MQSQHMQIKHGRTCWMTLKLAGTYSTAQAPPLTTTIQAERGVRTGFDDRTRQIRRQGATNRRRRGLACRPFGDGCPLALIDPELFEFKFQRDLVLIIMPGLLQCFALLMSGGTFLTQRPHLFELLGNGAFTSMSSGGGEDD